MKKSIVIVVIVLVIIVVLGFTLLRSPKETIESENVILTGEVIEIELTAKQWEFSPQLIEINLGDKVELHMESEDVTHGIVIPEYGISERLTPGEDFHVEFIADKKGIFNFYCNVPCGRGHGGMNGMIVVK